MHYTAALEQDRDLLSIREPVDHHQGREGWHCWDSRSLAVLHSPVLQKPSEAVVLARGPRRECHMPPMNASNAFFLAKVAFHHLSLYWMSMSTIFYLKIMKLLLGWGHSKPRLSTCHRTITLEVLYLTIRYLHLKLQGVFVNYSRCVKVYILRDKINCIVDL